MQELKNEISQFEYILKFGSLVFSFNDLFKYLYPDREIDDLQLFVDKFKAIKEEFAGLDPSIFRQPSTGDLYNHVKSSHSHFKEMLDNASKMAECIEAYSKSGNIEELRPILSGELIDIYAEQITEMNKLLDNLNKAYIRLKKQIKKQIKAVIKK